MDAADVRFIREGDSVFATDGDGAKTPVKLVWARPLSARGREICALGPDKKEVLMLDSLDALDADSRRVVQEELAKRYLMPRITRVMETTADFGMRYWHVATTLGERRFALKHASKNAIWITDDHLVLRDTLGCRYEIRPYGELDPASRAEVEKVI
jgi:uncharacterized protein DUF1854